MDDATASIAAQAADESDEADQASVGGNAQVVTAPDPLPPAVPLPVPAPEPADQEAAAPPTALMPRGLVVVLGAAATVIAVAGMRQLSWLLGPAFLSLMLVVAVSPVQGWLIRRRLPRWISTVVVLLLLYLVLVALVAVLTVSVAQLATLLPGYADQANALLTSVTDLLARYGVGTAQITEMAGQIEVGRVADLLTTVLASVSSTTSTLILVLTLMFFMGLDAADFPGRLDRLWLVRPNMAQALASFAHGTRRYLVVSSIFGAIAAVLDAIALQILSVPLPWLWAVLAFMTNYIPNVGFFIGLVPPAILALLDGGADTMVATIIVYALINVVIQTVIQPKFVGDSVGLTVTLTFVATVFWAWVLGPLGALLAIPMTLLAKALLIDVDPASGWINTLIGPTVQRPRQATPAAGTEPGAAT
jgi:AI-2 transport protein TqsA